MIPEEDIPALKAAGIREIFGPGTATETIVKYVAGKCKALILGSG